MCTQRTTQGIYIDLATFPSSSRHSLPLLIVDTEGLESSTRRAGSQHAGAIFDLTLCRQILGVADVVLMNVWEGEGWAEWQEGLRSAGRGLGKGLVVVQRDWEGGPLRTEIEGWEGEVRGVGLGHPIYRGKEWAEGICALRDLFGCWEESWGPDKVRS